MAITFKKLQLNGWRQFNKVDIEFHERLTILTGGNGAGKTTILKVLSRHFGWSSQYLAVPRKKRKSIVEWFSGIRATENSDQNGRESIGELYYDEGFSTLSVPQAGGAQFNLKLNNQQHVEGLFIPSHRSTGEYTQLTNLPINALGLEQMYSGYRGSVIQAWQGGGGNAQSKPFYKMKEGIISLANFGEGNSYVEGRADLKEALEAFIEVLRIVLPSHIGFNTLAIRIPEIVMKTDSGEFLLDSSSGGLMAVIDISWQIFLQSRLHEKFTVVIDEPENHLHPAMQRSILFKLLKAFPNCQFIVASHSPFIVTSVEESNVYALQYLKDENLSEVSQKTNVVNSILLDRSIKSNPASDILREVLGVPVTLPHWVEEEINDLVDELRANEIYELQDIKSKLTELGLQNQLSEVVTRMLDND